MTLRFAATRPRPARPWWVLAAVLPMALAGRATHAAPRPSHPHLFFADDDVEALQKRVESGVPQQAWESIVARCESEVGPDSAGAALLQDVQDGDRALQGFCSSATRYNDPLIDLATGWALSGDRRFADRLETLLRAAQGLFPEGIDFWRQAFSNSVTMDIGEALATTYDLGFTGLPSDLREWLRVALVTHCRAVDEAMGEGNLGLGEAYRGWQGANLRLVRASDLAVPALALRGERGFERKWVQTAIAEYQSFLETGLGDEGEYHENGAYLGYAMTFGSRGLYALKRAGHDLFADERLRAAASALAWEVTPGGAFNPLNDAEYQAIGWHLDGWRLLCWAYPSDPAANWLYREALAYQSIGHGSITALTAIAFHRDPQPVDLGQLSGFERHARYLPHGGRAYFRAGWDNEALLASLYSVATHLGWHGQGDANSLTLYGADGRWLIESGYGGDLIGPDAHNLVLIDGVGPPSHLYPGSGGAVWSGAGDITQFLDGGWASIAEGDAREAYGSLTWYREGMKTYPRSPVGKALRQLVFLHPDAANEVPGYFLVHDDIQEDADEHAYEWRFHTASENRIQETGHGLLLENRFNHDHYENLGEPTEQWLYHEFDLAEPGTYHLHAVARAPRYASAYIHTRLDGELVGYGSTGIPFWTTVPISNEPLTLAAGKHVVGLRQSQGPLRVAGVLLTRQDQAPPLSDLEAAGDALFARFDTTTDAAAPWRHVRQAESRCEVAFLRPDPLTISWDPFREQGHWRITEQTMVRAVAESRSPEFTVMLYPHRGTQPRPEIAQPAPGRQGYQAAMKWPDVTDYVSVFDSSATRAYEGLEGETWTPLEADGLPAVDGQLAVVRARPGEEDTPLGFVAVSATRLRWGDRDLVEVLDPGDYTAVTLVQSGRELAIHGLIRPDSIWRVSRRTRVRVYGPKVERVLVDGEETAFERDGDSVVVPITGNRHVSHRQRVEARIEQALRAP